MVYSCTHQFFEPSKVIYYLQKSSTKIYNTILMLYIVHTMNIQKGLL